MQGYVSFRRVSDTLHKMTWQRIVQQCRLTIQRMEIAPSVAFAEIVKAYATPKL